MKTNAHTTAKPSLSDRSIDSPTGTHTDCPIEQDRALWDILENDSPVAVSPDFTERVLAATQPIAQEQVPQQPSKLLTFPWKAGFTSLTALGAAAAIAIFTHIQQPTVVTPAQPTLSAHPAPAHTSASDPFIEEILADADQDPLFFDESELDEFVNLNVQPSSSQNSQSRSSLPAKYYAAIS